MWLGSGREIGAHEVSREAMAAASSSPSATISISWSFSTPRVRILKMLLASTQSVSTDRLRTRTCERYFWAPLTNRAAGRA